jgi:MAF protein
MCTARTDTDKISASRKDPGIQPDNARVSLASASPRRAELLALTGMAFETSAADIDESPHAGEAPEALVRRLAQAKAACAAAATSAPLVIAADTEVVIDGRILGKPSDREQAVGMLTTLRGREHRVITAIVVFERSTARSLTDVCETHVAMRRYGEPELRAYVETDAPLDKAGGYGIQDRQFDPVDMRAMNECYANVMGLPLCHLTRLLRRVGRKLDVDIPQMCQKHTSYTCRIFPAILQESG